MVSARTEADKSAPTGCRIILFICIIGPYVPWPDSFVKMHNRAPTDMTGGRDHDDEHNNRVMIGPPFGR